MQENAVEGAVEESAGLAGLVFTPQPHTETGRTATALRFAAAFEDRAAVAIARPVGGECESG
ncbi:hypothetical protein GCM10010446_40760 [Streptomyces enissocaesilis]|uniref:Uncharacterized protein n=1 Tax=Streptomyces enissocaesilis TaxID=332589 RepID=A0ABN3XHI6_9ACTN